MSWSTVDYDDYNDNKSAYLDSQSTNRYTVGYRERSEFESEEGILLLPLTNPTAGNEDGTLGNTAMIRLHNRIGMRRVRWATSKSLAPPIIPAPVDAVHSGDKIVGHRIEIMKTTPVQNGSFDWVVTGEYTYLQNSPRNQHHNFETGQSNISMADVILSYASMSGSGGWVDSGVGGLVGGALSALGDKSSFVFSSIPEVDFKETYDYPSVVLSNQFFANLIG